MNIFALFDTKKSEYLKYGTKVAWVNSGAAKNAFMQHNVRVYGFGEVKQFDRQDRVVVHEIDLLASSLAIINK